MLDNKTLECDALKDLLEQILEMSFSVQTKPSIQMYVFSFSIGVTLAPPFHIF